MSELLKSVEKLPMEPVLPRLSLNDFRGGNQLPIWDIAEKNFHLEKNYSLLPMVLKNWAVNEPKDLVLKLGTMQISVNRLRFMCYSKFAMENVKGGQRELELPEDRVLKEGLVRTCRWVNQPVAKLERGFIIQVLVTALFLEVEPLIQQVWLSLDVVEEFCEDQAFAVAHEALRLSHLLPTLGIDIIMLRRIQRFFLTLVASVEFVQLPFHHIRYLICSEHVAVNSEKEMFYATVRWLIHDWKARAEHAMTLLKLLQLMLLPGDYLTKMQTGAVEAQLSCIFELSEFQELSFMSYAANLLVMFSDGSKVAQQLHDVCKIGEPLARPFICDSLCSYHKAAPDAPDKDFTYDDFLEYLRVIQKNGIYSWKALKVDQHSVSIKKN